MKGLIIALLLVWAITALALWQFEIVEEYEFAIVTLDDDYIIEELNEWGKSGWEVVSSRRASTELEQYADKTTYELILQRRMRLGFKIGADRGRGESLEP